MCKKLLFNIEKRYFIHIWIILFPLHCDSVWRQRNKTSTIGVMADMTVFLVFAEVTTLWRLWRFVALVALHKMLLSGSSVAEC